MGTGDRGHDGTGKSWVYILNIISSRKEFRHRGTLCPAILPVMVKMLCEYSQPRQGFLVNFHITIYQLEVSLKCYPEAGPQEQRPAMFWRPKITHSDRANGGASSWDMKRPAFCSKGINVEQQLFRS